MILVDHRFHGKTWRDKKIKKSVSGGRNLPNFKFSRVHSPWEVTEF